MFKYSGPIQLNTIKMSNSRTLSYFLILTFLFMILIFSALASSNYPSQPKINEMSIFTIKNGRLYSVAFDGDAAYYNTFLPTAQKIIDSFRITK